MGIDPGSYTTGVALLVVDIRTWKIVEIKTELVDVTDVVKTNYIRDKLYDRLFVMGDRLSSVLEYLVPDYVSIESGYIDRFRPGAYGVLSKVMYMIQHAVYRYNYLTITEEFRPKVAKKLIKVTDIDKKATTLDALEKMPEITNLIDLNSISEHEIDGISLALVILDKYKRLQTTL